LLSCLATSGWSRPKTCNQHRTECWKMHTYDPRTGQCWTGM